MHHDRQEPKLSHCVDDGFVRVQVWVPRRLYRLPPVGREVCDPTLVEVEQNSFERWTIHTRTLPATRDRPAAVPIRRGGSWITRGEEAGRQRQERRRDDRGPLPDKVG